MVHIVNGPYNMVIRLYCWWTNIWLYGYIDDEPIYCYMVILLMDLYIVIYVILLMDLYIVI